MDLVFATNNQHKFIEVQNVLPKNIQLIRLTDIGCTEDIPETKDTIEGNAYEKSSYVFKKYGKDRTAMISSQIFLKSRSAIREVGKVYGVTRERIRQIEEKALQKRLKTRDR